MITYNEFIAIAKAAHAWDVVECWDVTAFKAYCDEFGPMTLSEANELCRLTKAVTKDELEAAKFYAGC